MAAQHIDNCATLAPLSQAITPAMDTPPTATHDQIGTFGSIVSPLTISSDSNAVSSTSGATSTLRPAVTFAGTLAPRPTIVSPVFRRDGSSQFGA